MLKLSKKRVTCGQAWLLMMTNMKNKFICFAYSINNFVEKDGTNRPKGFVWLTACFTKRNYRLFPIGYRK